MPRTQAAGSQRTHRRDTDRESAHNEGRTDVSGDRRGPQGAPGPVKSSHIIEEHIDMGVPTQVAYDQWSRYQDLARYSKKESAQVKRSDRVSFRSKIGPSGRSWEGQVVEQVPGKRIKWRSIGGAQTMGVVSFHRLDDRLTRLMVEMEYHPKGAIETIGNFFRMQRRRVRKDLKLFKHFIELRGEATGPGAEPVRSPEGLRQETDERLGSGSGHEGEQERGGKPLAGRARTAAKRVKEAAG